MALNLREQILFHASTEGSGSPGIKIPGYNPSPLWSVNTVDISLVEAQACSLWF